MDLESSIDYTFGDNDFPQTPNEDQMKITISELDDIIERLVNHDKYTGYTINENK